jgi:hypothetical protein
MMNINKAIWGITALALCLALAGCPAEDEEGEGATILNVPKMEPISSLHDFSETGVRNVGTVAEATTLFQNASTTLINTLTTQDTTVYEADDQLTTVKIETFSHHPSEIITVVFEDIDLTGLTLTSPNSEKPGTINGSNTVSAAVKTKGKSDETFSLANYFGSDFNSRLSVSTVQRQGLANKNDSVTEKFSGNRVFAITDGFYGTGAANNPYVAGYVTVEYNGTETDTQTDEKDKNNIRITSSSGDAKFSVTIVAYVTGSYGAKFRLSGTSKGSSATTRSVSSGSAVTVSNLEVYSNNGHKLYDLPVDQKTTNSGLLSTAWFTFAKNIVARSLFEKFYQPTQPKP